MHIKKGPPFHSTARCHSLIVKCTIAYMCCVLTSEILAAVGWELPTPPLVFLKAPSVARSFTLLPLSARPHFPLDASHTRRGGAPLAAKRGKEFNCAKSPVCVCVLTDVQSSELFETQRWGRLETLQKKKLFFE